MYNRESVAQEAASQVARKYTRHLTHELQKRHREKKINGEVHVKTMYDFAEILDSGATANKFPLSRL